MQEDFIRKIIKDDLDEGAVKSIRTRFPPEPNGYLHIGHSKSIVLNFTLAEEFNGTCNLRFDDTNPEKENEVYVHSIIRDIEWLGYKWDGPIRYASNYFEQLYDYAVQLIKKGLAYVDHSSPQEIREQRGTPTQVGTNSKYRNRREEENLTLFEEMREGKKEEGSCLLRAKIDMAHPNITMRDPVIYRIKKQLHHNTGDTWRIYPLYDFAHCLSDAIEHITHSLCTLEFEVHRPLYDWLLEKLEIKKPRPRQIEFSRLSITHTVLSKRKLKCLVDKGLVDGWDDPRLATLSGLRRRGYSPQAIQNFCREIGITKVVSSIEIARLEENLRQHLNKSAERFMVVLDPVRLLITNYPEDREEIFTVSNNPEDDSSPMHDLIFSRILYIEREDFNEAPPRKYFRLAPGREVRLKHAYYITCTKVIKDHVGKIVEIHAEYDPESRGGGTADGRRVKGTLHWVSAQHAVDIEVNNYDALFSHSQPEQLDIDEMLEHVNRKSHTRLLGVKAEPLLKTITSPRTVQFLRKGYYILDQLHSEKRKILNYNHTVSLKEGWKPAAS